MENKLHIFLVEDDLSFGAVLKSYLELNDYRVTWIDDGKNAMGEFMKGSFQICLLDVMLPNIDGFSIASEIRKINKDVPMVFLTAKTLKEDILKGYNVGADDYVTKPFDTEVLLCKINAITKRVPNTQIRQENEFQVGKYHFDYPVRTITHKGVVQKLSPKEADLLKLLCQSRNNLLPRDRALQKIWGEDGYFTARSMDVFITRLRKFLKDDPDIEIKNIHGSGFLLEIKNTSAD